MLDYQIIGDGGGGLYLAVFDDGEVIYFRSHCEQDINLLFGDVKAIKADGHPVNDSWDGCDDPVFHGYNTLNELYASFFNDKCCDIIMDAQEFSDYIKCIPPINIF